MVLGRRDELLRGFDPQVVDALDAQVRVAVVDERPTGYGASLAVPVLRRNAVVFLMIAAQAARKPAAWSTLASPAAH